MRVTVSSTVFSDQGCEFLSLCGAVTTSKSKSAVSCRNCTNL